MKKLLYKARMALSDWLHKLGNAVYPKGFGLPGFADINYRGKPVERFPSELNIGQRIDNKGRVIKVTAPPVYDPEIKRKGGRMVKRMPRQLQKIKQGQETPRDE